MALALFLVLSRLAPAVQEARPPGFDEALRLLRSGQLAEAERAFLEVLSTRPEHAASSVYLSRIYARSGRSRDAESVLIQALSERPEGVGLLNELATLYLDERKFSAAEDTFERTLRVSGDNVRALDGLVEVWLATGEPERASARIRDALRARPDVAALHLLHATIELRQGRYAEALSALDEMQRLGQDGPNVSVVRTLALQGIGRLEEALAEAESARERFPHQSAIERTHGLILMTLNRDTEAVSVLKGVIENDADDATAWVALGELHFRRAELAEARSAFERAAALESSQRARFYLGEVALMELRFEDAVTHYRGTIELDPHATSAHQRLGEALFKLGRYGDARSALEDALAISDQDPQTHYLLGQVLRESGQTSAAVAPLVEARRLRPNHSRTRYLLGVTFAALGRMDEARSELQAFRELKRFEDLAEVLELALIARPDDATSFRKLIDLYVENGREQDALPLLEKAVSLSPDDAELLYRLARVRLRDGRARDGMEALERAHALDPNHPLRAEVDEAFDRTREKS